MDLGYMLNVDVYKFNLMEQLEELKTRLDNLNDGLTRVEL